MEVFCFTVVAVLFVIVWTRIDSLREDLRDAGDDVLQLYRDRNRLQDEIDALKAASTTDNGQRTKDN